MRSMTFRVDDRSADTLVPAVLVTVTENANGTLTFSITQQGAVVGDLRGVFFDVANESLISHLTVSAAAGLTEVQRGNDSVVNLGNGANMHGLVGSDGGYDMGLEVGTSGIGKDDYRNFSFTLGTDNGRALTLEDFANVDFGVRLTSVGALEGARNGGAKLLETTSGAIDAIDDHAAVKEDTRPGTAAGNVLANDHGADSCHSTIVAVNGSAAGVGVDVNGIYGKLHLNRDGSYVYTLDNTKAGVQALAEGQEVSETFTYKARSTTESTSYSEDSASLIITLRGTNDAVHVTAADGHGNVAEDRTPSASGVLSFSDVDLSDTHAASFTPAPTNTTALGTFALAPVNEPPNAANGSVGWTYTLNNAAAQSLSEGQTLSETYNVQLDDGHGSVTSQAVTVSIAGTNDGPAAQAISQRADENGAPVLLTAAYSDVDALDTHTFSVDTTGTHGSVTNNGDGSFAYDPNGQFESLADGEVATDTFTYTVADNHGGSSSATATVAVHGANDAPVATGGETTGVVFADGSRHAEGAVTATDVDHGAVLTWSLDNPGVAATPDFRFLIDNLRIVRGGVQYFNDDFGDNIAPPSIPGVLNETVPTGSSYAVQGSFVEAGGRVIFDGLRSIPVLAPGTTDIFYGESALLLTDTSTDLSRGLKSDDNFTVEGRFDLILPDGDRQSYGVRLVDVNGSDVIDVRVRHEDGRNYVVVREADVPGNTSMELGRIALDPALGENQIVLRLTHDAAHPGEVHASFDLLGAGSTRSFTFAADVVGHIFGTGTPGDATDDEVFTRAQIFAAGPADMQNGTYGTLHIEANGQWNYVLDNAAADVRALAQGEHATDTFMARVTDEHGASVTQTISIDVSGSNDFPIFANTQSFGFVAEDSPSSVTSGTVSAVDPDHGATLTWSVGHAIFGPGVASAYSADYRFALDDLNVVRNGATLFDDEFDAGGPPPSAPNFTGTTLVASYSTTGLFSEEGGRLIFDGHVAGAITGIGDDRLIAANSALLNTNIDPADLTRGLKADDTFTAAARFDLATPAAGQFYGVALSDQAVNVLPPDQRGDDSILLVVRRDDAGHAAVQLVEANGVNDTFTVLGSMSLAPLAGETQIVLRLSHDVHDVGTIHAGFDLVGPGVATRSFDLTEVGHIFGTDTPAYAGDDEDWTRVQIIARGEDTGGDTLAGTYGTMHVDQSGNWAYVIDNSLASTQSLAQNQFVTDQFTIRATDEHGLSSFRTVPVTVAGTNDFPNTTGGVTTGAVVEDAVAHFAGTVSFTDVDLTDSHFVLNLFPPNPFGLGMFALGPVIESPNTSDGSIAWTYDLFNDRAQYLADGEIVQETNSFFLQDSWGGMTPAAVTVTIAGTNDPVSITSADTAGTVIENLSPLAAGAIDFTDVDLRDTHVASFTPAPTNGTHLGTFALGAVDEAPGAPAGSVTWTYALDDAAARFLAQGQTVTETYTVTLDDDHGSLATRDVSITIVGTEQGNNQPPVALPDTNADDALVEQGFAVPGLAFVNDPFATGSVLANDIDPDGSVLQVSALAGGSVGLPLQGSYGFLTLNADGTWNYSLNNGDPDTDALAPGETASEQFTYTVSDPQGAASSSTLTIAIAGSEDPAIALPGGNTGSVTEDVNLTTSGQLAAFDPDHGAVLHWQFGGGTGTTTADYHYTIDRFTVTRNGASLFDDQFADGLAPPGAPNFFNGTAAAYITRGLFTEAGDRAVLDGQLAQTTFPQGLPGPVVTTSATLNTNTDSTNLQIGLKDVHDFNVAGVFDFAIPDANQLYGIGLTDLGSAGGNNDLVQLVVSQDAGGGARLTLRDLDATTGLVMPLESTLVSAAAGDQLRLVLQHEAAHVGEVTAGYVVLHDNVPTSFGTFTQHGHIFGTDTPGNIADDERFTRATFFALAQGDESSIGGTYGTLHLHSYTGQWDYTLNSGAANVQALAAGRAVTDSFNVFVGDEYNFGVQQTINVTVNGLNDAPVANADLATTTPGQPIMINALANDTDIDTGAVLSLISASAPNGHGTASVSGNQVRFDPGSDFADLAPGEQATVTLTYTISDEHGAQSSSTIGVMVTGQAAPAGVVYEDGSRRADGQLSTAGLDDSLPITATITGAGSGAAMANYHFLVDNLTITRGGTQVFNDDFGNGVPPSNNVPNSGGANFDGVLTPYGATGTFVEAGGRVIMDGTNGFSTAFGTMAHVATLLTDSTNSTTGGLKQGDAFAVEGRFDLVMPAEEHQEYGIRLSDSVNGVGNDIVELAVRRENGAVVVVLRDVDQGSTSATATILETRHLNLLPGDNQIILRLDHAAGSTAVSASFTLSGGAAPHGDTFTAQDNIFSNETWTRAAVVSIAPQLPQNGTYGNLSVDADGGWVYQTKNNLPALQALAQGEQANDVFNVELTDAHGATQTRTITVAVTGSDDVPFTTGGVSNAVLMEGHVLTASGLLTASDIDNGATLHWSIGDRFAGSPTFSSAYQGRYHFLLDELQITKNGNPGFFDDTFDDGLVQPPASSGFSYGISGAVGEINSRALYDGSGAVAQRGPGVEDLRVGILQVLNSNTNPVDTLHGLKSTDSFTASARFDLPQADDSFSLPTVPHAGQAYGLSLGDSMSNGIPQDGLGDDAVFLMLQGAPDGSMQVVWSDRNVLTDEARVLGSMALPVVPGAAQIVFHLSHDASNSGTVHASFDLVGAGVSQTFSFTEVGHIFGSDTPGYTGDDENWTRVQIVTTSPDTGAASVHGTYGTLSIDDTGRWTYALDNSPLVDGLVPGQPVNETFAAQVIDEHGLSTARPININIQGSEAGQSISYFGSAADETVTSSPAIDFITGGGGSDTFVYHNANPGGYDFINDFTPGTGPNADKIDIRDVLSGSYVPGASNIADFVQVADFGDHSTLMVDPSGPAHTAGFTDLAILQGVTGWALQSLLDNHNLVVS